MFVCNLKINGKKIWKVCLVILSILIIALLIFAIFRIVSASKNNMTKSGDVLEITTDEYTNFLKASHESINNYVGKTVKLTGYIYRLPDFSSTQFVIARTMVIDDNMGSVIVGMLCECNNSSKFDSGSWIEVTGIIKKGNYNGEIPVLEISDIKTIKAPKDEFVYMPVD